MYDAHVVSYYRYAARLMCRIALEKRFYQRYQPALWVAATHFRHLAREVE